MNYPCKTNTFLYCRNCIGCTGINCVSDKLAPLVENRYWASTRKCQQSINLWWRVALSTERWQGLLRDALTWLGNTSLCLLAPFDPEKLPVQPGAPLRHPNLGMEAVHCRQSCRKRQKNWASPWVQPTAAPEFSNKSCEE